MYRYIHYLNLGSTLFLYSYDYEVNYSIVLFKLLSKRFKAVHCAYNTQKMYYVVYLSD